MPVCGVYKVWDTIISQGRSCQTFRWVAFCKTMRAKPHGIMWYLVSSGLYCTSISWVWSSMTFWCCLRLFSSSLFLSSRVLPSSAASCRSGTNKTKRQSCVIQNPTRQIAQLSYMSGRTSRQQLVLHACYKSYTLNLFNLVRNKLNLIMWKCIPLQVNYNNWPTSIDIT